MNITAFAGKPTLEYARSNLHVAVLEEQILNNVREGGEIQLTGALDRLRREDGCLGRVIDGQRFDIGCRVHT